MEEFIRAVVQRLPEAANIAEIERVLMSEYPQVLRDVLQSICLGQDGTSRTLLCWRIQNFQFRNRLILMTGWKVVDKKY